MEDEEEGAVVKREDEAVIKQEEGPVVKQEEGTVVKREEGPAVKQEGGPAVKLEEGSVVKQEDAPAIKREEGAAVKQESEDDSEPTLKQEQSDGPSNHHRIPKRRRTSPTPLPTPGTPQNWELMYSLVKEMRLSRPAPVDTMGCERAHDTTATPQTQRFQTLISLMLSSQTKDTVNFATMARLRSSLPGGLTLDAILATPAPALNELISAVGFHRKKTEYIKRTAEILRERWNGEIPDTLEGLMALPGVGPKMAHLCMSAAWGMTLGIGVDVHVHRICNLWGWVRTKNPEETRKALEGWLPRDKWREINWLLVGFGQTVCLPRGRKCGECKLAEKGICRAAFKGDVAPVKGGKGRKRPKTEDGDEEKPVVRTWGGMKGRKELEAKNGWGGDDEDSEEEELEVKGGSEDEFKPAGRSSRAPKVSPRRTVRRRAVKAEIKTENGDDMMDIEDAGSA